MGRKQSSDVDLLSNFYGNIHFAAEVARTVPHLDPQKSTGYDGPGSQFNVIDGRRNQGKLVREQSGRLLSAQKSCQWPAWVGTRGSFEAALVPYEVASQMKRSRYAKACGVVAGTAYRSYAAARPWRDIFVGPLFCVCLCGPVPAPRQPRIR